MSKARSTGDLVASNLITTDISNDRIGIGSDTPSAKLDVLGDVNISGVITATSFHGDGSSLTGIDAGIGTDGSVNTTGIITATSFSGDGSGLTGIATNIQAGANITVLESPSGNFIVTSTASGGGGGSNGFAVIAGMIF